MFNSFSGAARYLCCLQEKHNNQILLKLNIFQKFCATSSSYVPDVICFASVYHTNFYHLSTTHTQNLIRHAIISHTRPPQRVDCLAHYGSIGMKCLFQGHNDTLRSSQTKPRADNLAIANLHFILLICTPASWDDGIKCLF